MNAYRGTNVEQDIRFGNKEQKLLKTMRFDKALDTKVDIRKVQIDVIKPWITKKLTSLLGIEDDIVSEFCFAQLEEKDLNPKRLQVSEQSSNWKPKLQINITGFLNARRAREFVSELWTLLVEAQESPDGIPESIINKKMEELKASASSREITAARATENDWKHRYQSLTGGRYGKTAPVYKCEPGAADEMNSPESPSNRRWKRERTPDIPIPRRNRSGKPNENSDRPHGNRDRRDRRSRSTSRQRTRRRRSPSSSPDEKRSRRRRRNSNDREEPKRSPPRRKISRDSSDDNRAPRRRPSPSNERRRRRSPSDSPPRRRVHKDDSERVERRKQRSSSIERRRSSPKTRKVDDRPQRREISSPENRNPSPTISKKSKRRHDSDSEHETKRSKKREEVEKGEEKEARS
ncbi:Serine arginine repetitive matrix protein [Aphelenchoides besseyi]|nr:Serine arginine repetitive matrix protein [Aphelenchoides besseyi]